MTPASEAHELTRAMPTESQLLDVLYEVLAQGVPPKGSLTVEDVERFLHEHARSKKSITEMMAFFERYKLPTDASDYGADPALGELASGLHRERGPISATFSLDDGAEAASGGPADSGPVRKIEPMVEVEDTAPRARSPEPPASARRTQSWLPMVAMGSVLLLGGALFATHHHAQELSRELEQARLQQRTTDVALSALEQRAETLKSFLERSEADRNALAARFDQFVAGEAQQRAAEEAALERLLGKRYETLRDKALQQAMLNP